MSRPAEQFDDDLLRLLSEHADGEISAADRARLANILRDDPSARATYFEFTILRAGLWQKGGRRQAVEDLVDQEVSTVSDLQSASENAASAKPRPKSLLDWASRNPKGPAIAIAATVLIAALVVMGLVPVRQWMAGVDKNNTDKRASTNDEFVARLTNWQNDKWLEDSQPPRKDPRLRVGKRLVLESGRVEITYNAGARVVLNGPAEYWVVGKKNGQLLLGKLVAEVNEKTAKGFAIDTPSVRVEDFGTEFGVEVNRGGAAEVVVLSGEVDVVRETSPGVVVERIRLTKNQGVFAASKDDAIRRRSINAKLISAYRAQIEAEFTPTVKGVETSISPTPPTADVAIQQATSDGNAPWRFERPAGNDRNPRDAGQTFFVDAADYPAGFVLDKITIRIDHLATTGYDRARFTLGIYEIASGSDFAPEPQQDSCIHAEGGLLPASFKRRFDQGAQYLSFDLTDQALESGKHYAFLLMLNTQASRGDNMLIATQTNEDAYAHGRAIRRHNRGAGGDAFSSQQYFSGALDEDIDMEFYLHGSTVESESNETNSEKSSPGNQDN